MKISVLLLALVAPGLVRADVELLPSVPEAVSNNAVALRERAGGAELLSFNGISKGRTWRDTHTRAFALDLSQGQWRAIPHVPVDDGRLASVAVNVGGTVWLIGGYTVAADGSEVSTPEVFRLDPDTTLLQLAGEMPVPVDDMTAFAYRDRWIYLVSGWHDLGNVNLVQVLDTQTMEWSQATPYPGAPVFGHAGGLSGDSILVCGGVRIEYPQDATARKFLPSEHCWRGSIDPENHRRIQWRSVAHHPGPARYRAAATADDRGRVVFAGGSDNPYNFDGIGYNGEPSEPLATVLAYDFANDAWREVTGLEVSTMDHRGLLFHGGWYYLVGGMKRGQQVTDRVVRFQID